MAARPGNRTLYVAQQTGVVRGDPQRRSCSREPVVDLTGQVSQDGGERGLLGHRVLARRHAPLRRLHRHRGNTRSTSSTMQGAVADPGVAAHGARGRPAAAQPQRRRSSRSVPTAILYIGARRRRRGGRLGPGHAAGGNGQSLGTLLGKILRIDPTPSRRRARTRCRPTIRSSAAPAPGPRSGRTGCATRGASRSTRQRRPVDRRRRRRTRREEIDHDGEANGRDAGQGDNFGWNRLEGNRRLPGTCARRRPYPRSYESVARHRRVRDGRRLRVPGHEDRGRSAARYLFSDNCDGTIRLLVAAGRDANAGERELGPSRKRCRRSVGMQLAASIFVLSAEHGVGDRGHDDRAGRDTRGAGPQWCRRVIGGGHRHDRAGFSPSA